MREIKFRAGHSITGGWYYGCSNPIEERNELDFSLFFLQLESGVLDVRTTGQYTGLKDKNSREIYEGDLLKVEGTEVANLVDAVTYEGSSFILPSLPVCLDVFAEYELEVIGNIWE